MSKLSILIAEEDRVSSALVESVLLDAGYNVHIAENGQEALDELSKNMADLVITSIHLPGASGIQLLEHIRQSNRSNIPVLALSSNQICIRSKAGFQFDDLIPRPITAGRLLQAVDDLLENH